MRHVLGVAAAMLAAGTALLLAGCASGGDGGSTAPEVVIDFTVRMAAPINESFYYFVPIDTDGDFGVDGPVPVAAGPFWQNGWGTGSFSHYVQYHLGQYTVFRVSLAASLTQAGGGIVAVGSTPQGNEAGTHALTVETTGFAPGEITITGSGVITTVTNTGLQSAGDLRIQTDAQGRTVAGGVSFTPASVGGRALTTSEQAVLTALDAGGVALQSGSLSALGISLNLGAPAAGTQVLTVGPTTAQLTDRFAAVTVGTTTQNLVVTANSVQTVGAAPGQVLTLTTRDLIAGESATVEVTLSPVAVSVGPPFDFTRPQGSDTLRFTVDLATLGTGIPDLSVNCITTNELIFDPSITDPNQHSYDGLGALGNRYVTFRTAQFQTITNDSGLFEREGAGDSTLIGPTTQAQRDALDIVYWSITIRRLR